MQETNAIAIKLPPFWPNRARVWFAQAQAQFVIKGITNDLTKYSYVTASLDQDTATRVLDILTDPPADNKYETLKGRLIEAYQLTEREAAAKILDTNGLGDCKPTELLDKMLALVPAGKDPGFLFKEVFLRQLPPEVQSIVTQQDYPNLRELAKAADRHFLSTGATVNAAVKHPQRRHQTPTSATDADLCFYHQKFGARAKKCTAPCSYKPSENSSAGRR